MRVQLWWMPSERTRSGMVQGEFLGDVPAHGKPHDMGLVDAGIVENMGRVIGHVGQAVARFGNAGFPHATIIEHDGAKVL